VGRGPTKAPIPKRLPRRSPRSERVDPFRVGVIEERTLLDRSIQNDPHGRGCHDADTFQRILATVVVRGPRFLVNREGAIAFQEHLTRPATQARIRAFRLPGIDGPVLWPAGNQNDN
jgi:hypothetical protein